MDLDQLREFVSLSKTLNFTKTARELNLSQPALSNHISKLEKELGVGLIDRNQQNPRLTAAGSAFLETAYVMLDAYDRFAERAADPQAFSQGRFAIQTLQHVNTSSYVLLKRVRDFKKIRPGVTVDVQESLSYNTLDNIRKGLVDCGFYGLHLDEPQAPAGVHTVLLTREEFVVWVDEDSSLCRREGLSPADLTGATVPFWVGSPNDLEGLTRELFDAFGVQAHLSPRSSSSREDFFLNQVRRKDVVILTEGSEDIYAIRANDERVQLHFDPPLYANSYLAIRDDEGNEALAAFEAFVVEHAHDVKA